MIRKSWLRKADRSPSKSPRLSAGRLSQSPSRSGSRSPSRLRLRRPARDDVLSSASPAKSVRSTNLVGSNRGGNCYRKADDEGPDSPCKKFKMVEIEPTNGAADLGLEQQQQHQHLRQMRC